MTLYGKTAVGLGETLNLPVGSTELMEKYHNEFEEFLQNNNTDFKSFIKEKFEGKNNKVTKKEYFKHIRSKGLFKPEIVTADDLIQRLKNTYSGAFAMIERCSTSGIQLHRVSTLDPFGRIRFFSPPENTKEVAEIGRAAGNFPIQSSSANMMKYAIVKMKQYIEQNNLSDIVKFALPIHDEAIFIVKKEFAEEWLKIQTKIMEDAGEFILGNKLQKAEGGISEVWTK